MTQFETKDREHTLDSIEDQLADAIGQQVTARRKRRRNRVAMAACSVVLLGALSVGVAGSLSGTASDPVAPAAAEVLEMAAKATEDGSFSPRQIAPGEFLYTNEISVARFKGNSGDGPYFFDVRNDSEQWVGADLSGLIRVNEPIGPKFLSSDDKQRWADAGSRNTDSAVYPDSRHRIGPRKSDAREGVAPPGYFDPENTQALIYGQDTPDTSDELLDAYDVESQELVALARNQRRFDRYARNRVRRVTKRLSHSGASSGQINRSTDRATFSLAFELLSQRAAKTPRARAALLRLAATADDQLKVDPNVRTMLGKPGVGVTEVTEISTQSEDGTFATEQSTETIIFDPNTFVVLETREDVDDTYGLGFTLVEAATNYEYGYVKQLRERPDGQIVSPMSNIEQLD